MFFGFHLMDRYSPEEFQAMTLLEYLSATYTASVRAIDYVFENQLKGTVNRMTRAGLRGGSILEAYKQEIEELEEQVVEENADFIVEFLKKPLIELNEFSMDTIDAIHILFDNDESNSIEQQYLEMVRRMTNSPYHQKLKEPDADREEITIELLTAYFGEKEPATHEELNQAFLSFHDMTPEDENLLQKIYVRLYNIYKKQELLYILIAKVDELSSSNVEEIQDVVVENSHRGKSNHFSTAQSVLALMILNKKKQISKSQDRKPFQDFIADLTGLNHRNIGDIMTRFNEENQYLPHKSKKKNLEDYQKLRIYIEKMQNSDALDFIDNQINIINNLEE